MKKVFGLIMSSMLLFSCADNEPATVASEPVAEQPAATKDYEVGDVKLIDIARQAHGDLSSGNVDAYLANFADNATYRWNNYDSILGKPAITEYWKKRRTDVMESINFSNEIYIPIMVNRPQSPMQTTGNYVLVWSDVAVQYKGAKSMKQRIHTAYHFDGNGKIDRVSQYVDRAPINAAQAK